MRYYVHCSHPDGRHVGFAGLNADETEKTRAAWERDGYVVKVTSETEMRAMPPRLAVDECVHRNIHPARIDGARTVCFDCKQTVSVQRSQYASGKSAAEQFDDALTKLNAAARS